MKAFILLTIAVAALQLATVFSQRASNGYESFREEAIAQLFEAMIEKEHQSDMQSSETMIEEESQPESIESAVTAASQSGVTYIRWGSTTCSHADDHHEIREKLYDGQMVGAFYNKEGAGSNYLCLPPKPDYGDLATAVERNDRTGRLWGTEYEHPIGPVSNRHDKDVPCSLCYVPTRSAMIMIPGTVTCPSGWSRDYYGYLMGEMTVSGHHHKRTEYLCVDRELDTIRETHANKNGALIYHISVDCSNIDCSAYDSNKVLPCVVCTK